MKEKSPASAFIAAGREAARMDAQAEMLFCCRAAPEAQSRPQLLAAACFVSAPYARGTGFVYHRIQTRRRRA